MSLVIHNKTTLSQSTLLSDIRGALYRHGIRLGPLTEEARKGPRRTDRRMPRERTQSTAEAAANHVDTALEKASPCSRAGSCIRTEAPHERHNGPGRGQIGTRRKALSAVKPTSLRRHESSATSNRAPLPIGDSVPEGELLPIRFQISRRSFLLLLIRLCIGPDYKKTLGL